MSDVVIKLVIGAGLHSSLGRSIQKAKEAVGQLGKTAQSTLGTASIKTGAAMQSSQGVVKRAIDKTTESTTRLSQTLGRVGSVARTQAVKARAAFSGVGASIRKTFSAQNLKNVNNWAKGAFMGTAAVAMAAVGTIKIGIDYEDEMARVRGLTGATEQQFQALNDKAKELGRDTRFRASEAAQGMQYLAMAGFNPEQILGMW